MKNLKFYILPVLIMVISVSVQAQMDLLDNNVEDGSFSTYTVDQTNFWTPTLKPGVGFWGTDGANGTRTSIRVHNTETNPQYKSAYHYLQVCMDENNSGCNYVWRKFSVR